MFQIKVDESRKALSKLRESGAYQSKDAAAQQPESWR